MMIRGVSVMLVGMGMFLFILSKIMPFFAYIMMDWVGLIAIIGGVFVLLVAFPFSDTGLLYDTIPGGAAVIPFIRRDGNIIPLLGKRVFSGESFLDIPKLGLVEDLGQGTVFLWGRKKIRFGLENISYTPDPHYANLCATLRRLGFDDSDDLWNVMNIPIIKDPKTKTYYLTRMAEVYWNMMHMPPRGAEKLLEDFKVRREPRIPFGKKTRRKPVSVAPKAIPTASLKPVEQPKPVVQQPGKTNYRDLSELDRLLNSKEKL